jgi:opacity protein-like surface antigen
MKTSILALSLLAMFAATSSLAAERLSAACKGRIAYDLAQKGYDMRAIKFKGIEQGDCDNETCNPDVLQVEVVARAPNGRNYVLAVDASTQARGEPEGASCRVYSVKRLGLAR